MVAISHNFSANIAKSKTLDLNDLTSIINLILVEKKIVQNEIVPFLHNYHLLTNSINYANTNLKFDSTLSLNESLIPNSSWNSIVQNDCSKLKFLFSKFYSKEKERNGRY